MSVISSFITLCRPKFLIYTPIYYSIGCVLAKKEEGILDSWEFVKGLVFVWMAHIMTHFFNEYYDYETDCKNKTPSPWTGGSRVLP